MSQTIDVNGQVFLFPAPMRAFRFLSLLGGAL